MVRKILIEKLYEEPDSSLLGRFPTEKDYDEVIDEDCDVYLPDGSLAVVFRKAAIKSLVGLTPETEDYKYWRWASRSLLSDQRGAAAGSEIRTNVEIRVTAGQKKFFNAAVKRDMTLEEALELSSDSTPTVTTYYVGKAEEDGLVDLDEVERWDSLVRKKSTLPEDRVEAVRKRNAAKLAWFQNWLRTVWEVAEDKVQAAKDAKKRYFTGSPRGNKAYSAVFGTITRSGRTPFGRLTAPTLARWEEFQNQGKLFNEVSDLLKQHVPEKWQLLSDRFSKVADERYTLCGTVFTSLTVNHNFAVARHVDGANSKGGIAVLSALDNGSFDGFEFVLHPMRLAFNLRTGDFLACDNDSTEHSITEMKNASEDAESITFVWYSKDLVLTLDSLECETCRREFLAYVAENYPEYGTGEAKWNGSAPGLWSSQIWNDYKALRSKEGGYDYTLCSNTNINGDPDTSELVVRQPHLVKNKKQEPVL